MLSHLQRLCNCCTVLVDSPPTLEVARDYPASEAAVRLGGGCSGRQDNAVLCWWPAGQAVLSGIFYCSAGCLATFILCLGRLCCLQILPREAARFPHRGIPMVLQRGALTTLQKGVQAAGLGFALRVGHASMHVSIGTDTDLLCRGSLVHIKGVVVPSGRALSPVGATPGRLPRFSSSARSRQATSQNPHPRVATCSGRADGQLCCSGCSWSRNTVAQASVPRHLQNREGA